MEPSELRILRCLPFFMAMRAGIRAHVAASQYSQATTEQAKTLHAEQARFHLAASVEYLSHVQPKAIAVGGFSGSGKSTIAANLAPLISNAPGALRVRSDEIRRQLMEWDEFSPMPQSAYTPQQSEQVYTKMLEVAKTALAHGHSVILDAVFDRPHDQKLFKEQLSSTGANFQGFWLQVEKEKMQERIAARTRDASDATIDVLHMQLQKQPNTHTDWTIINADGSIEQNTNAVLNSIK
ncbi:AAA family ATPase [Sneathiella glossodoripedis]|uniref:AAA family ATPase n=1 Tax=Sneathiella glossodoripedis TaxID=418853 RepID=UPI00131EF37D|nr:AAA family ATPase [Sneathiella glossodoripedis]